MAKSLFVLFLFILQLGQGNLVATHSDQSNNPSDILLNWGKNEVLTSTERRPARTAILIIAPPKIGNCYASKRWKIGKKTWEQYMNSHPNVDCYFIQCTNPDQNREDSNQVWLEGNTIYVGDWEYAKHGNDRILHKTIAAMEWLLPNYTHFIRTNLNTFINLKNVNEYMETHHQSFYTTPIWQSEWYTVGYSIMYTADVAAHIVSEYKQLVAREDRIIMSPHLSDDCAMTALATGVWPLDVIHPFRCCPTLPFGTRQLMCPESLLTTRLSTYGAFLLPPISLKTAIKYCNMGPETMMLYRIREGLSLSELGQFYQYLLEKIYPEVPTVNVVEYAEWIDQTN